MMSQAPHYTTAPEDRIPFRQKLAYGVGAFVNNLLAAASGGMMIVLNLGLGMNPALVGLLGALPRLTDALTAAKLGVTSIEHLSGVPEAAGQPDQLFAAHRNGFFAGWTAFERSWVPLDSTTLTRLAGQLADTKVTMVPTLVLHEVFSHLDDTASATVPDLLAVPADQREAWNVPEMVQRAGWTAADFEAFRQARPRQDLFVRAFSRAGGVVVTGTDASNQRLVPGASEHDELALLVGAGLTPTEALRAATRDAAVLLGADSLGTLVPGKAADLVVLGRDPLADITNTRAINYVMIRGQLIRPDSIRNRW